MLQSVSVAVQSFSISRHIIVSMGTFTGYLGVSSASIGIPDLVRSPAWFGDTGAEYDWYIKFSDGTANWGLVTSHVLRHMGKDASV